MTSITADRAPDRSKGPTATAIRESAARLSPLALRRLREGLFKLEELHRGLARVVEVLRRGRRQRAGVPVNSSATRRHPLTRA